MRGGVAAAVCVAAAVAAHVGAGGAVSLAPVLLAALVAVPVGSAVAGREADVMWTAALALFAQGTWHTVFMLTAPVDGGHAMDVGTMLLAHLLAAGVATAVCFTGEHQLDAVRRWVVGLLVPRLLAQADEVSARPGPLRSQCDEVAPQPRSVVRSHPHRGPPLTVVPG